MHLSSLCKPSLVHTALTIRASRSLRHRLRYLDIKHACQLSISALRPNPTTHDIWAPLNFDMPPDYEDQSFWEERFKREKHFEWLGDGQSTIIPRLRSFIHSRPTAGLPLPPRLLQIGAGTSSLSDLILGLYTQLYGDRGGDAIVNADFAQLAVDRGRTKEGERGSGIQWVMADVLQYADVARMAEGGNFEVVVDKSTSDALSCGKDVVFSTDGLDRVAPDYLHPGIKSYLLEHPNEEITLEPVEVAALHLASIVRPGGIWIVLSYSSDRFSFTATNSGWSPETGDKRINFLSYWDIEKEVVDAPPGWGESEGRGIHMPKILHYMYILRRTDIRV